MSKVFANGTSTVALLPGSLAGAWGYRRELRAVGLWPLLLIPPSLIGGWIGAEARDEVVAELFRCGCAVDDFVGDGFVSAPADVGEIVDAVSTGRSGARSPIGRSLRGSHRRSIPDCDLRRILRRRHRHLDARGRSASSAWETFTK